MTHVHIPALEASLYCHRMLRHGHLLRSWRLFFWAWVSRYRMFLNESQHNLSSVHLRSWVASIKPNPNRALSQWEMSANLCASRTLVQAGIWLMLLAWITHECCLITLNLLTGLRAVSCYSDEAADCIYSIYFTTCSSVRMLLHNVSHSYDFSHTWTPDSTQHNSA